MKDNLKRSASVRDHLAENTSRGKLLTFPRNYSGMANPLENTGTHGTGAPSSDDLRIYLQRLLASPAFSISSRRGQLLKYLVEHTLAGDGDKVSEYAIGLDVFQKPASFDPRIESVVRTEVSRLRQRLKDYYADEGRKDPIVIDFPQRSYAATFDFPKQVDLQNAAAPSVAAQRPSLIAASSSAERVRNSRLAILAVVLFAALAIAGYAYWKSRATPAGGKLPLNSIVVLPFENYSVNGADQYLADGMTEELTNDLAEWRDLRVVARTSAYAFKGKGEDVRKIGTDLNVDAVLEGSFTKQGERIRITAQLNRTSDGYHLWSHSYESQSSDLMAVQDQVASAIAATIRQVRGGNPPVVRASTNNPEAHDLYLQGEFQLNVRTADSLKKAVDLFNAAIAKDPSFAAAYIGIARAEIGAVSLQSVAPEQGIAAAKQAAQKAIDLDANLGEAHGLLATIAYTWDWDWPRSESEFRRAIDLGAGAETRARYGWSLATRGRFAEAHEQLRSAQDLDPLATVPYFDEVFVFLFERNFSAEHHLTDRMLQLNPDYVGTRIMIVDMKVVQHQCPDALTEAKLAVQKYPAPVTNMAMAMAYACGGDKQQALSLIHEVTSTAAAGFTSPYVLALTYATLGDRNNTIAQLQKSADHHEGQILYIKYDPSFDNVRADARFVALEKRVGLVP
jgi:TolB-like protein/Tfp pilus assembly protein PilF